ncbi:MAG: SprB repeat-containing protein, partial [Lewinella sp.]|nr:SprB repeat-containing protein [Lewinella sp.]
GNGPYSFDWGNGVVDSVATNLGPGTGQVVLTDANGCVNTVDYALTEPEVLTASATAYPVDCQGNATGSVVVLATGGTGAYNFLWDDPAGQTLDSLSALPAATYQVEVTDANGCTTTAMAEVTEPPLLTAQATADSVSCFGQSDGAVAVAIAGGTPMTEIAWTQLSTGSEVGTSDNLSDLPAGVYEVAVTDANGCIATDQVTISQPDTLELVNLLTTDPSCDGAEDGTAAANTSGGTGPYTITWQGGVSAPSVSNLGAGLQSVQVSDANGCFAEIFFELTAPTAVDVAIAVDSVSCAGGADGVAAVLPNGGTAPYSYVWSDTQTDSLAIGLAAGPISVEVTDANGCIASAMNEILEPTALALSLDPTDPSCNAGTDGSIVATAEGGVGPYSFAWDDGQNQATAANLAQGDFEVVVTDANGCTLSESATLGEPAALSAMTNAEEQGCNGPPDGTATITVSGGTGPYEYLWADGQTTATATGLITGDISVAVTDAQGCVLNETVSVPQAEAVEITAVAST